MGSKNKKKNFNASSIHIGEVLYPREQSSRC